MGRIVDIPFGYRIAGVPRRSHNVRTIKVVDIVPVELPEFSFEELTPVVRTRIRNTGIHGVTISQCLGGYVSSAPEVAMGLERFQRAVEETPERLRRNASFMDHMPGLYQILGLEGPQDGAIMHSELQRGMRTVVTSNEDEVRKEFLDRIVPSLAIVDGRIVQVQDEPVWKVGMHRPGGPTTMHLGFAPSHRKDWTWSVRLDGLDRARSLCAGKDVKIDDASDLVEDLGAVEWKLDEVRASAGTFSRWLLQDISMPIASGVFQDGSPAFFQAFCTVRDHESHSVDDTVAAARVIAEEIPRMEGMEHSMASSLAAALRHIEMAELQPVPDADLLSGLRI